MLLQRQIMDKFYFPNYLVVFMCFDQGSKSAIFFRSGKIWSGAVERKFQKNSISLVFVMNFSRIIAQGGPKRSHITPDALARFLAPF